MEGLPGSKTALSLVAFYADSRHEVLRVRSGLPDHPHLGIGSDQTADMALRYVPDNSAVSTVIAGMRTVRKFDRNTAVSDGQPLTAEQLAKLTAHRWERNFYQPA